MVQRLDYLPETASQTAGPYVHIGLAPSSAGFEGFNRELGREIAGPEAKGARIRIDGRVYDGTGAPVKDAVVESWQANASGIYAHPLDPRHSEVEPGFRGWGRAPADLTTGDWRIETVKPGRVATPGGGFMAPHLALWIVARGVNVGLNTRLYFEDEAAANAEDPVLQKLGPRAATLLARREGDVYRFDVRIRMRDETVFFDV